MGLVYSLIYINNSSSQCTYDCSIRRGEPFLLSNVLDTKGEGVSPSHGGDFLEIWVVNSGFVHYKLEININYR